VGTKSWVHLTWEITGNSKVTEMGAELLLALKGKQKLVERRRYERFQVQKDAFAMITPLSPKKGEIIDISRGGLALRYIPEENQPKLSVEIGLFLHI